MRRLLGLVSGAVLALVLVPGCTFVAGLYGDLGSLLGSNANASCDRRYGEQPEAFCQEIDNTVAGSQFQDDCAHKFHARTSGNGCPRELVVGGCAIDKKNDDGSTVTDWYYDVSSMVAEAGSADAEGEGEGDGDADAGPSFPPSDVKLNADDVRVKCADPARYSDGAHFVTP
jgi:hypothetical protein